MGRNIDQGDVAGVPKEVVALHRFDQLDRPVETGLKLPSPLRFPPSLGDYFCLGWRTSFQFNNPRRTVEQIFVWIWQTRLSVTPSKAPIPANVNPS